MRAVESSGCMPCRTVLVIDENNLFRELLVAHLDNVTFTTHGAGSITEAWEVFKAVDPDALVVDVSLTPGKSGLALAEQMVAMSPGIGLVFLTNVGHPRVASPDSADIPPGSAYLHKSAVRGVEDIVAAVDAVLREDTARIPRHDIAYANHWGQLSTIQIDVLRLVADALSTRKSPTPEGHRSRAVEALISRTFDQLDPHGQATHGNKRVLAAREYLLAAQPVAG